MLESLVASYGDSILVLPLDVTDRAAAFDIVAQAKNIYGRLDVVINNAGYGQFGAVEELSEAEARAQIDTNLFGALWVTQAALPIMREQRSGHILSVSSIGGVLAFPIGGMYQASKWALEGLMDTLSQEVARFNIKITLIEPGGYATDFSDASSVKVSRPLPAYDPVRDQIATTFSSYEPGNPMATVTAILKVVDAPNPPLRLLLGSSSGAMVRKAYEDRLATWDKWASVTIDAQG